MSEGVVLDASVVVSALLDGGAEGQWAAGLISTRVLVAPHLMPGEASNIIRRSLVRGAVSLSEAAQAHGDLLDLPVELFAFHGLADRVWQLRDNLTAYDAWYVALAEELGVPLATLDRRLARATGLRCEVLVPPAP